jgi:hypothetical protein
MASKRFQINAEDIKSWGKTALIFLIPAITLYINFVLGEINKDGFQPSDFIPSPFIQGAMVVWCLNEVLAFFKKFVEGK